MELDNLEAYIQKIFKNRGKGNIRFQFSIKLSAINIHSISINDLINLCSKYLLDFRFDYHNNEYITFSYLALCRKHWYLEELKNEGID